MDIYEKKRNSLIYRKKNMNLTNNNYNSKENKIIKHISNFNQKNYSNNIQNYINNINSNAKNNKNQNISLKFKKEFPFYKIENANKNLILQKNNKTNNKDKLFASLLQTNNNFNIFLTDLDNNINEEINNTVDTNDSLNNIKILNNTYKGNEVNKNIDNRDRFINSNDTLEEISIRRNTNENNLNNSIFIKKKPAGKFLRNNSAMHRNNRKKFEESFNDVINKSNDDYLKNYHEILKYEKTQTINNRNININISINNNFLTEKINNNVVEKPNNKIIKMKDKNMKNVKENNQRKSPNNSLKLFNKENIKNRKDVKKPKNNDNSINTKLYNLEDILLIIQKFELIRDKYNVFSNNINKYNPKELLEYINIIRIKIYDLYKFYMSCSIEGSPQNLYSSAISKNCLQYYSCILVLTLGLCYIITQKIKTTMDYHGKLLILLNLQEKAFMIYCDAIIKKVSNNYQKNIWVIEIIKKLKNQLISNADTVNHILQIKILSSDSYKIINDILMNIYILDEMKSNEQELFLYNNFFNKDFYYLSHFNANELEDIFDKNIFKVINLRSNYANIASLKYSNKNNNKPIKTKTLNYNNYNNYNFEYKTYKNNKKSEKVPYLNFPPTKEYTLVLDLDETMISFKFTEFDQGLGKLHLRPGLEEFLEEIKKYYEIIVFTSGTKDYAEAILNIIEHKNNSKYFDGLLYREHTTLIGKKYIKDLSKLGRDLSKTIIVDNLPQSYKFQRENGILINSFYGDNMNDRALYELKRILINIYKEKKDVRNSINKYKEDIIRNVTCIDKDVCNQ